MKESGHHGSVSIQSTLEEAFSFRMNEKKKSKSRVYTGPPKNAHIHRQNREEERKKENGVGDTVNHDRSLKRERETAVGWKEEDLVGMGKRKVLGELRKCGGVYRVCDPQSSQRAVRDRLAEWHHERGEPPFFFLFSFSSHSSFGSIGTGELLLSVLWQSFGSWK